MRSRHALTAALALGAVTILAVAACGSSVQRIGAGQPRRRRRGTSAETSRRRANIVDATELYRPRATDAQRAVHRRLTVPIRFPDSDFPLTRSPSGDLGDLNIPGYNNACIFRWPALYVEHRALATLAGWVRPVRRVQLRQTCRI